MTTNEQCKYEVNFNGKWYGTKTADIKKGDYLKNKSTGFLFITNKDGDPDGNS